MARRIRSGEVQRVILLLALFSFIAVMSQAGISAGPGTNYRNYSVDTKVNITGSPPVVMQVRMPTTLTLSAGNITGVVCNATIRDYNGWNDLDTVNGTFFLNTASDSDADENNTHYSNTTCERTDQNGYFANYSCTFPVNYYANNGTWRCNVRVNDSMSFKANLTNTTTISPLYALNVSPLLDYGDIAAGDFAGNRTANVTNLGNRPINITVKGYGRTIGDNLSFVCDQGNLSLNLEHFAANSTADYGSKQTLNSSFQPVFGLTIPKTSNASLSTNSTYWELYVDPSQVAYGGCNGTIVFQAETA